MTLDPGLLAHLDLLKQQFAAGLPERFARIDAALDACCAEPPPPTGLAALATALHSLAGSAGIFGFTALGEEARSAEQQAMGWTDHGCTREQLETLRSRVLAWRQTV